MWSSSIMLSYLMFFFVNISVNSSYFCVHTLYTMYCESENFTETFVVMYSYQI
jgi:hypothetical protein